MCMKNFISYLLELTAYLLLTKFLAHELFFAHESHESTRIFVPTSAIELAHIAECSRKYLIFINELIGDLFGRTNHTNSMISRWMN